MEPQTWNNRHMTLICRRRQEQSVFKVPRQVLWIMVRQDRSHQAMCWQEQTVKGTT